MLSAIAREKAIKEWKRAWKVKLIYDFNSAWSDLWPDIVGVPDSDSSEG
jgi:putative endonuclease